MFKLRRRAARQKRKSSAQENGGTGHHDALTDGIRQRKPHQPVNSPSGRFSYLFVFCVGD